MSHVIVSTISDSIVENLFSNLLILVSPDKQKRISKFRFDIDRKLSLYSELLVRHKIREDLGIPNSEIVFSKNEHGKPYLQGYNDYHFNISHTKNAIAAAFSKKDIGVDVERIQPCDMKIAERFFSPEETAYIRNQPDNDKAFYEIWTKKEAYIKYLVTGLSTSLQSFSVLQSEIDTTIYTFNKGEYIVSVCYEDVIDKKPTAVILTETELEIMLKNLLIKFKP